MTDDNDISDVAPDASRRSAATAAIGAGAIGEKTTATANATVQRQADLAFVFTYDYRPNTAFRVIANLQQEVVDRILGQWIEGEPVVRITANYNAFLASYRTSGGGAGEHFLLFTQFRGLRRGQSYRFDAGAAFFTDRFNLLEVGLESAGDGGGSGGSGGGGNQTG